MEAAAEPGTVLVSENTYRLVENRFHWQKLGDMNFKGMSKPVAVYRPISPRFDFETAPELQAYGIPVAMTGREDEFKQLKDVLAGLYRGRGGIVLVSGEKGIGKSLLVTQVRQYFSREEGMLGELGNEGSLPATKSVRPVTHYLAARNLSLLRPILAFCDVDRCLVPMVGAAA